MKLLKVHVKEFKSVIDSNEFEVGDITCLVGKNEAGKTSILHALYRLNPIIASHGKFDVTEDYPRADVGEYQQQVENGAREAATVVGATFQLDPDDLVPIEKQFGVGVVPSAQLTLSKGYALNEAGDKSELDYALIVDETIAIAHLLEGYDVDNAFRGRVTKECRTVKQLSEFLTNECVSQSKKYAVAKAAAEALADDTQKAAALAKAAELAEDENVSALQRDLAEKEISELSSHLWHEYLIARVPKFLYFDEYYQMQGRDNIPALKKRKEQGKLLSSDQPLLGLIELARLDLDQILGAQKTQDLKNKLGAAGAHLTKQILKYWSQNKHLRLSFDVREGLPQDPPGMQEGKNIWGEVEDTKHNVFTGLATRSKGFVWFFSFLAWYSAGNKKDQPLVLLLDEPALSLHGKAQEDLLRYFDEQIASNKKHQLLYTTHSPFMVDPKHFDRVRIVQDRGIDSDEALDRKEDGTKVFSEVLEAGADTLFPLQGALGYEIYQTLFVGPNCLVVEGVSDLLYLQIVSGLLEKAGREGLSKAWTITPVGGSDKVPTFVALIGAQKGLRVATLIDYQKNDKQSIENLYKKKLLKKSHVHTFADYTGKAEADIEDMFDEDTYLELVNGAYANDLQAPITPASFTTQSPRVVVKIEQLLKASPLKSGSFNHYRPARHLVDDAKLQSKLTPAALDRFEAVFMALNTLVEKK